MTAQRETIMKDVRPFGSRVAVSESDVDEEQLGSGLILPVSSSSFKRGVVLAVPDDPGQPTGALEAGVVVFYRHGTKIGDVVVVDLCDVIAYQAS